MKLKLGVLKVSDLVDVGQQHGVGGPQVFGRHGAVLQSMRVHQRRVLFVPQPHRPPSAHGQILT